MKRIFTLAEATKLRDIATEEAISKGYRHIYIPGPKAWLADGAHRLWAQVVDRLIWPLVDGGELALLYVSDQTCKGYNHTFFAKQP